MLAGGHVRRDLYDDACELMRKQALTREPDADLRAQLEVTLPLCRDEREL
jgi:hypothetical protein